MKKATISIVISAHNEERKIKDCLESAKWADEIILIDNSSNDKTAEIAKRYTAKVFTRPNNPMLNVNKNFGFSKASSDWILSLDADERVSNLLKEEIQSTINSQQLTVNGFWIPRKNIIFRKWIRHTGWYPDYQLRLFKKGKGKFAEQHVHEMIHVEGTTGYLKEPVVHYNYETANQFLQKLTYIYTVNEAEQILKKGYQFHYLDAIRFPLKEFLNRFLALEGYKDGLHGLVLSMLMAFYHFIVFVKIWEKQDFVEFSTPTMLSEIEKEGKKAGKQLRYWFANEELKSVQNPIKSLSLKIKRRLFSL